jgi:acetyl-CoA decarbonylase/synthase complex subunit gamma
MDFSQNMKWDQNLTENDRKLGARDTPNPVDVYRLLPRTNCRKCGHKTCVAFASKLVNREVTLDECAPLLEVPYEEAYRQLWRLLRPPVKQVVIGTGDKAVKIGGEFVIYRHELSYINPTAIAIDVTDELTSDELMKRIKQIKEFSYTYLGRRLGLDLIAIRSTSNDPAKFAKTVRTVTEASTLPLVLCSLDPRITEAGLESVPDKRPLLYAATEDNCKEMAALALKHNCPLAVRVQNNLERLRSMTEDLMSAGIGDLVLDPVTFTYEGMQDTLRNFSMLRWISCKEGDEFFGLPIAGTPIEAWASHKGSPEEATWREAAVASLLITHYASLLIMHTLEGWALLPIVILRQNLYTDPRKPTAVEPGLRVFGEPDENSPVMFTTNFSLTYFTVSSDIESSPISNKCYLLVVDSEGVGVRTAAARASARKGGITAEGIAKAIKDSGIEQKVKHKTLIIPGLLAGLKDGIEKLTGWRVMIGPSNSAELPKFLEEHWYKSTEKLTNQ